MAQRLPIPGQDNGTWGDILNAYLEVSLNSDGTLANNTVGTNQIQSNAVTNAQLDNATQTTLASVASKYTLPGGGIPKTDLASSVQTSLSSADSSVQSVNNVTPTSGNVSITAGSINAVATSQLGAVSGVATLDSGSHLTAAQLPSSVVSSSSSTALAKIPTGVGYVVNVVDYGAVGDGATDSTAAIQAALTEALATGLPLYFPGTSNAVTKPYLTSQTLNVKAGGIKIFGDGHGVSGIQMTTANTPLIQTGAAEGIVEGLGLLYASQPAGTDTSANAIEFYNTSWWAFRDLHFYRVGRALYIPQVAYINGANYMFSCVFENLYINEYSISAISLAGYNGDCSGSVLDNIYTNEGYTAVGSTGGGVVPASNPVYIYRCDEMVINQLNIEDVNLENGAALVLNDSNVQINGLHFEQVGLSYYNAGLVNPYGNCHVSLTGMTAKYCDFNTTGGGSRYVYFVGGSGLDPQLWVEGLLMDNTSTIENTHLYLVGGTDTLGATASLTLTLCDTGEPTSLTNYTTASVIPPIKRINDTIYHEIQGGNNIVTGTAAPTTGTWAVGDICRNTNPTLQGTSPGYYVTLGWTCTTAGTPGTWEPQDIAISAPLSASNNLSDIASASTALSNLNGASIPAHVPTNYVLNLTQNYSSSPTANLLYYGLIAIPVAVTLTGVLLYTEATAAGNILAALYNKAGTQVAHTVSTAQGTAYNVQSIPFTSTYAAAADEYYLAVMYSSASATFITGLALGSAGTAAQGSFALPSTITPPTASAGTFIACVGTY